MQTGWKVINGSTYYLKNSGAMAVGIQLIDGYNYKFDSSGVYTSKVSTGWMDLNDKQYYFNESGEMQTGWLDIIIKNIF